MPGIPQGRDINEAGPKSVTLVTIHDDRSIQIDERVISVAQFELVTIDPRDAHGWSEAVDAVAEGLRQTLSRINSDHLVARIQISGTTPLAWRIRRDLDLLREEVDLRFSAARRCWIEKIDAACRHPENGDSLPADPLAELDKLIENDVLASDALQAEATAIGREMQAQLPPELRRLLGEDESTFQSVLRAIAHEGSADVLARLQGRAEQGPI
jgi:DNA repair protein SbcD/Mre11